MYKYRLNQWTNKLKVGKIKFEFWRVEVIQAVNAGKGIMGDVRKMEEDSERRILF